MIFGRFGGVIGSLNFRESLGTHLLLQVALPITLYILQFAHLKIFFLYRSSLFLSQRNKSMKKKSELQLAQLSWVVETSAPLYGCPCVIFSTLRSHMWHWLGISSVPSGELRHHFLQFTNMAGMPRFTFIPMDNLVCFRLGDMEGKQ